MSDHDWVQGLLREELRGRTAYGAPQLDVPVRLNTNENSYPLPDEVVRAVGRAITGEIADLNRYPDRDAVKLRADLAAYCGHGLTAEQLWAANGSNEIQQQLFQAFAGPGRVALGFGPAYSMHPLLAAGTATTWVDGGRGDDFGLTAEHAVAQVRRHRPALTLLCSPNNPTGTALDFSIVEAVLAETEGLVLIDEAYAEFRRPGTPSALELLDRHPRLVVSRTMSKAFAFAGARVGYLAAHPAIVEAVQLVRLPYHLSALTQAAARAALAHADVLLGTVEAIKAERDRIVSELRLSGWAVADSDANFVLFGRFEDQQAAWRTLLDQGVLVRDVGLPGWLRVTAGTHAETTAFLNAMKELQA
ncbi:histidinol-phosphate aminotransferase [Catellatospora sp. IY07-71]|uniref:histidinol-phosphate transaminase n=1 Tax=Catellatospora sp. IY07-71 TaxID=2728827 RepID=UPI001BB3932A|nr:histidinol-phosphate transaminase [Catellatospora sp. IY07-71]BCJ77788.1 histidinol-phosphate aminotransferase [Catellatospora sp. IY07-71]